MASFSQIFGFVPFLGGEMQIFWSVGLVLAAALVGGQLAALLGLPRVTAYLLAGLALGPNALELIPKNHLGDLEPFGELAMALVLFHIGCHFTLPRVRRILSSVLPLSIGELAATFLLVTAGTFLFGASIEVALLLGTLALATAPATTMLVFREKQSEGPITEYALALLVLNNLAAIVLFELMLISVHAFGGAEVNLHLEIRGLFGGLLAAITLGATAGFFVSYATAVLGRERWLVLLLAMSMLLLGVCHALEHLPHLVAFLAMGVTVANASDQSKTIEQEIDRFTSLLCVVFFVIEGAKMDLQALGAAGMIGVAFVVCRSAGKYFGVHFMARRRGETPVLRNWLGATTLSQAGVAIVLCSLAADYDPDLGASLRAIVLGTVIVFEILGPILVRQAIIHGGEVPLAEAIRHTSTTPWQELVAMINRLLLALGKNPWAERSPDTVKVSQLMRSNVKGVPASATFHELVDYMEHSHDNTFPVVAASGELLGVIRYNALRDVLFDPDLGTLVCASDLAQATPHVLSKDDTADRARALLNASDDDALPVVDDASNLMFSGVVRRRDLMRMLRK